LIILPNFFAFITGTTYLVKKNVPLQFTANILSHCSSVISSTGHEPIMPATLTRMSICPSNAAKALSTTALTCSSRVTSPARPSQVPSSAEISFAAVSTAPCSRSVIKTLAPLQQSPRATPLPMAPAAPVTRAVLLLKSNFIYIAPRRKIPIPLLSTSSRWDMTTVVFPVNR